MFCRTLEINFLCLMFWHGFVCKERGKHLKSYNKFYLLEQQQTTLIFQHTYSLNQRKMRIGVSQISSETANLFVTLLIIIFCCFQFCNEVDENVCECLCHIHCHWNHICVTYIYVCVGDTMKMWRHQDHFTCNALYLCVRDTMMNIYENFVLFSNTHS